MECLMKLIGPNNYVVENSSCVFLACDTIMNLLLKVVYCWHHSQKMCFMILVCKRLTILLLFVNREQARLSLDESTFVHLLKALAYWTGTLLYTVSIYKSSSALGTLLSNSSVIQWKIRLPPLPAPSLAWFCYHLFK